jgi:hypothetical protein
LAIAPMPPSEPISDEASNRHQHDLAVRRRADLGQRFGVFLRDEIVDRLHVALGDGFGDHLRRLGFGFRRAFARLGVAEGSFARPSASSTWLCFSLRRLCAARSPSAEICARLSRSAFIWRPIDSTRSAGGLMSLISTRVILMPQGCAAASTTLAAGAR